MSYKKAAIFSIIALSSSIALYTPAYAAKKTRSKEITATATHTDRIAELQQIVQKIQEKVCATPEFNAARERFEKLQTNVQELFTDMYSEQEYQNNCEAIKTTIVAYLNELLDSETITEEEMQQIAQVLVATFFPQ